MKLNKSIIYGWLALATILFTTSVVTKSTYFAPSASSDINKNVITQDANAYLSYIKQYGYTKEDITNYQLGTTNIKVSARGRSNDSNYPPKLKLYVNGVTKPYYDIKNVPLGNNFSLIEWNIPYLIKEGDQIALEYFNDTENDKSKDVFIDYVDIEGRRFDFKKSDNRIWYDRSNTDNGSKYGDQNDFGTAFDNKEILRFNDYIVFKSAGFIGDMYWNGAVQISFRKDQNDFSGFTSDLNPSKEYRGFKAEYVSDKNRNRFFDDAGVIVRNENEKCFLVPVTLSQSKGDYVDCFNLYQDYKYSSPAERYDLITNDFFLAHFTKIKYFYPGTYKFTVISDDGIRLFLDGALLIDRYNVESGPRTFETTQSLTKGDHEIRIEYLESHDQASVKLKVTPVNIDTSNLSEDEKIELMYEPYIYYDELADSDGDGLLNIFELSQMQLKRKPDLYDTNKNGVSDGLEDEDQDSLPNILEQKYKTNPLEKDTDLDGLTDLDEIYKYKTDPTNYDTDEDGLNDGFEVTHGLNPNSKDSNSNGKLDANEIVTFNKTDNITGTNATVTGEAILSEELKFEEQNPAYTAGGAEKTMLKIVDIVNSNNRQVDKVTVSLNYDDAIISKTKSKTPDKLKIVYLNDKANNITLLDNQKLDKNKKTVSGDVTHLSMFVLIDQDTWDDIFAEEFIPGIRGSNGKLNVVFLIDDSSSMVQNDPLGNRIKAPVELIDGLKTDDKAGAIVFNFTPTVLQELTSNKATIKTKMTPANLHSNGETNLSAAIRRGVEVLRGDSNNETSRILIALTDGVLDDRKSLENEVNLAIEHNVKIYTIGLGSGVDDEVLKDIARDSGGKYYKIQNSQQIIDAYSDIRNQGKDTDGDGLSDTLETGGIRTCTTGVLIKTDPNKWDTDGDKLSDGQEAGIYNPKGQFGGCYEILSNPLLVDTDRDGDNDFKEYNNRTQSSIYDEQIIYGFNNQYKSHYLIADLSNSDKVCFKAQVGLSGKLGEKNNDGTLKKDFKAQPFNQLITDQNANLNGYKPKAAVNTDYVRADNGAPLDYNFVQGLDYSGLGHFDSDTQKYLRWTHMEISKNNDIKFTLNTPQSAYNVSGGGPKIFSNSEFSNPCSSILNPSIGFIPCYLNTPRSLVITTTKNYFVALVTEQGLQPFAIDDAFNSIIKQQIVLYGFDLGQIKDGNMFDSGGSPSIAYDFNNNGQFDKNTTPNDIIKQRHNSLSAALLMFEGDACKFK